jgi:hypothetical protein
MGRWCRIIVDPSAGVEKLRHCELQILDASGMERGRILELLFFTAMAAILGRFRWIMAR